MLSITYKHGAHVYILVHVCSLLYSSDSFRTVYKYINLLEDQSVHVLAGQAVGVDQSGIGLVRPGRSDIGLAKKVAYGLSGTSLTNQNTDLAI
jgi:hypothetical protein